MDADMETKDTKSRVCIWIIMLGLLNFLAFTVSYSIIGGEPVRGKIFVNPETHQHIYILDSGAEVSKGVFIYMGIHSISIWLTVGAIMLAMLILAKDRISDSLREAMMRGRTLCSVLGVLITICMAGLTFQFIGQFSHHFNNPIIMTAETQPNSQPVTMPVKSVKPSDVK